MNINMKELVARYTRWKLIKSAQRKVAEGKSLTSAEINAVAYEPLQNAMRSVRESCPFRNK